MFYNSSQLLRKYSGWKWSLLSLPFLSLALGSNAGAQAAPSLVIDSQQPIASGLNQPQSLAVNGTQSGAVFIADTNNNQVAAVLSGGYWFDFNPPGFTLSTPQAVALDAKGDLFIADSPTNQDGTTYGRIIEMPADSTGHFDGTAHVVFSGSPLVNPISLAVGYAGTIFIGDLPTTTDVGAIYSLAPGATTLQQLNITGLNSPFTPGSLLRDSGANLYIADNGNLNGSIGGVYVVSTTGGAATKLSTQSFVVNQPSGLTMDSAGNLFILSLLGTDQIYNPGQQVLEIPAANPAAPFIVPTNGLGSSSSLGLDANGNLDVLVSGLGSPNTGQVVQLNYAHPQWMGQINTGQMGGAIQFNFEFNAPATLRGFSSVVGGDASTAFSAAAGGTCVNGAHNNIGKGGPAVSPFFPYTCLGNFQATPQAPGLVQGAIQVKGAAGSVLGSTPVYLTGVGPVEVTYPLNAAVTVTGLQQPQSVVISGGDKTVYVADTLAGQVFSIKGLGGSALTPVFTGTFPLQAPSAVALDGAGNLDIADFNLGEVIQIPVNGSAPFAVIPAGGLLKHPLSMAFDYNGNLYVGDSGPAGFDADSSNPGYIVKVAAGTTTPVKMVLPAGVNIVFPQALAGNPYTGDLLIGDGGDPDTGIGQVLTIAADGTSGSVVPVSNVTDPTSLAFDAAGELYVLDGLANTISTITLYNNAQHSVTFDNTLLTGASSMAMSTNGQTFIIANVGNGSTNQLIRLNGNASRLAFGNVKVGQSSTMEATEYNIGNADMTLSSPWFSVTPANPAFSLSPTSTCGNGLLVGIEGSCTIDVTFKPVAAGATTQQLTVNSNALNTGVPILTVRGTGK
jgi:Abnormal spindle-like microcephaly-assoc'd, ASPM-SPD-2-Hydin